MATTTSPADTPVTTGQRLSENSPVFAQRPEGADPSRHNGILIGNIRDQFVLVGGFTTTEFREGESIILRMVFGNHLIGFPTQVAKVIEDPRFYLVRFPLKVETLNLRKAQRIQAFFPAEVHMTRQGGSGADLLVLKTRVLDISAGGCSFRSKTKLAANAEIRISFTLPGDRHVQSVAATIIDCAPSSGIFHNRVRFSQEASNLAALQEIGKWVTDSITFTG